MPNPKLEEVFKKSGVPTYTFVKPTEYLRLLVALRTPGRGVVVEGPSGIGKTTSVLTALQELGISNTTQKLSGRKTTDKAAIESLPTRKGFGTVLIDDFHRIANDTKRVIADLMKTLADEEDNSSKIVIVGINRAGDALIRFAPDLSGRIDTLSFERNPDDLVRELVEKGEQALNVLINTKAEIVKESQGSFNIAQTLCHESCVYAGVLECCTAPKTIEASLEVVRENVLSDLSTRFMPVARKFATGPRLRREGRAPYLHILNWLANSEEWSLNLEEGLAHNPDHKPSVGQVVEKGLLASFIHDNPDIEDIIHYDPSTRILGVEDPKFVYFIKNLLWTKFAKQVGFIGIEFKSRYDFALSFAGSDRETAEALFNRLIESETAVFYDKNEQHRILAENVEDYLGPIYRSEARFVIALLGQDFPKRIWTKFESEQFKKRFGEKGVIPIWFADAPPSMFDVSAQVGGFHFDKAKPAAIQVGEICQGLLKKLAEVRTAEI